MLNQNNKEKIKMPENVFPEFYKKYAEDIEEKATNVIKEEDGNVRYEYNLVEGKLGFSFGISKTPRCAVCKFIDDKCVYVADIQNDKFLCEYYYNLDNSLSHKVSYDKDGILNSASGPSKIYYNKDGSIQKEEFWINGEKKLTAESLDNVNITSSIFNIDGKEVCVELTTLKAEGNRVFKECTFVDGVLEGVGKSPAYIVYDKDGNVGTKKFFKNGKLHNTNGAAELYYENGKLCDSYYHIEGKCVSEECYKKTIKDYNKNIGDLKQQLINVLDVKNKIDSKDKNFSENSNEVKTPQTVVYSGAINIETKFGFDGDYKRIITYPDKKVIVDPWTQKSFNKKDELHSFDGQPSLLTFKIPHSINSTNDLSKSNKISRKEWHKNNQRHRENGPAVEYDSGFKEYWFEGKKYSKKEYYDDLMLVKESLDNILEYLDVSFKDMGCSFEDIYKNINEIKGHRVERNGNIVSHYLDNSLVRTDYLNDKGDITLINFYNENGKLSSPLKEFPATIVVNDDGSFENHYTVENGVRRADFYKNMNIKALFLYKNGKLEEVQCFDVDGKIYSCKKYNGIGLLLSVSIYSHSKCDTIMYHENGKPKHRMVLNRNSDLHGIDSFKKYDEKGWLISKSSHKDGLYHCFDGAPSIVDYGDSFKKEHYIEGINYRTDKPSIIEYEKLDGVYVGGLKGIYNKYNIIKEHYTDSNGNVIKTIDHTKIKDSNLKIEATFAGYRIAANQISKAVKNSILMLMQNKGMEDSKLKHLKEILDSEIGTALISVSVGYVLSMDKFKDSEKFCKLAKEFRIEGMAGAGNVIVDSAVKYILPSIINENEDINKFRVEGLASLKEKKKIVEDESEEDEDKMDCVK